MEKKNKWVWLTLGPKGKEIKYTELLFMNQLLIFLDKEIAEVLKGRDPVSSSLTL